MRLQPIEPTQRFENATDRWGTIPLKDWQARLHAQNDWAFQHMRGDADLRLSKGARLKLVTKRPCEPGLFG